MEIFSLTFFLFGVLMFWQFMPAFAAVIKYTMLSQKFIMILQYFIAAQNQAT